MQEKKLFLYKSVCPRSWKLSAQNSIQKLDAKKVKQLYSDLASSCFRVEM